MIEKCRESGCRGKVPQGKGLESFTGRLLHRCRYCYRMKFPNRPKTDKPRKQAKHLTPYEREYHERRQFEGMEPLIWRPEFHRDWKDYLKDKWGN